MQKTRTLKTQNSSFAGLLLLLLLLISVTPLFTQDTKPKITLEDLFASRTLRGERFRQGRWDETGPVITFTKRDTADVTHLMSLDLERDEERQILDGSKLHAPDVDKLINIEGYAYSHDGTQVLVYTDSAPVWRLNTKGYYYIYNIEKEILTPLSSREEGFRMFAKFSPDGKYVAFVRNRNLYLVEVATMQETELTSNGSEGKIINGTTDWVYEEELNLRDGWYWSPDSKHIAFFQFDEANINEFYMVDLRGKKPKDIRFRFPLAGEPNSEVRVGVVNIDDKKTSFFETGTWYAEGDEFEYIARMGWTPKLDGKHLVWMIRMNREQNHAEIVYGNPENNEVQIVLQEKEDTWVEVVSFFGSASYFTFLEDGEHFIWLSERDGFRHIYLCKNSGEIVRQVTSGDWKVTQVHGIDERNDNIYFTATAENPRERHLYVTSLKQINEAESRKITQGSGVHTINMSRDSRYFIDTYSNINTPPVTRLHKSDGKLVKVLEDNEELMKTLAEYELPRFEFLTVKAADEKTSLHAYMLKPSDFEPKKTYPLLIYTYGGPGVQHVMDRWGGALALWHIYMAEEHDFVIAAVDNRGSAGYGKVFASSIHKNLGTLEPQDQIAAARQWGALPYIDENRIGIWGASYGGYNTLLSMMKYDGPGTIKLGIAMSSGVDFQLYDTIYTEKYMSTPGNNEEGYKESNVVNFVDRLQEHQKLLIVHGDLDDNAHYQGAVALVAAPQKANKRFSVSQFCQMR